MKPTCKDFVFARDGGTGRSPTEEAIIDYIDRSEEVATPSPAAEREIVVGSTWANCDDGHVIVTGIDDYGVRYSWVSDGTRGERTPRLFRERWSHVSDPQPASPDARRKDLCTCGHRRAGHVIDGYCLACPNCAGFTDVNAPDPTDPGVIRAAEGVVLEPGQYEVVEIAAIDTSPQFETGEILRVSREARAVECRDIDNIDRQWAWPIGSNAPLTTWVTAVRRVQEQAPQAAFSRDDTIAADCGAFIPAPQAEAATGKLYVPKANDEVVHMPTGHRCRVLYVRQSMKACDLMPRLPKGASWALNSELCLAKDYVEPVTEPFAPATPRSESASHAHWVQVADTRLGQIRGLNKQLDSTRNELHRASIGRNEALAKAAEQLKNAERERDEARAESQRRREGLDIAESQLSTRTAELEAAKSQKDDVLCELNKVYKEHAAELEAVRVELLKVEQQVRTVINRDQSGLAAGLAHVMAIARGYEWIPEGHWGSYESDAQSEAVLRAECGNLIRGVVDGCMRYLRASGKRADEAAHFKLTPPAESPGPAPGVEAPEVKL